VDGKLVVRTIHTLPASSPASSCGMDTISPGAPVPGSTVKRSVSLSYRAMPKASSIQTK
jgi:hypothetical protein